MSSSGLVEIKANEFGVVQKKIGSSLSSGQCIALNDEAGFQADLLAPGVHFIPPWKAVQTYQSIYIPQGEIGLVVAKDGLPLSKEQTLARSVDCNDFQDARTFLENGGQRGRQLNILKAGTYRIHPELFTVITRANAEQHGVDSNILQVAVIEPEYVGIVRTYAGKPISPGEIAGPTVIGHSNFQNPQVFLDRGGLNGLQEEILPSGAWNLNPWFVTVEPEKVTKVEPGYVVVVVAHTGRSPVNSNPQDPVAQGEKGVCERPLYPGKHPLNKRIVTTVLVSTSDISLQWEGLTIRSTDGFLCKIEVTQVINIKPENAPRLISKIGCPTYRKQADEPEPTKELVLRKYLQNVWSAMIGKCFRQAAKDFTAWDLQTDREALQNDAAMLIEDELRDYGVQPSNTCINDIDFPAALEKLITKRQEVKEEVKTIQEETKAEKHRQRLANAKARTEIQGKLVGAEIGQYIAQYNANSELIQARTQAQSIQIQGVAKAAALRLEVQALGGFQNFLAKHKVDNWGQIQLPNVLMDMSGGLAGFLPSGAFINPRLPLAVQSPTLQGSHPIPQLPSVPVPTVTPSDSSLHRCPVILLLDTSHQMSEDYLAALLNGINRFEQELADHDVAKRCVEVSIITFGGAAKIKQNFAHPGEFTLTSLELDGESSIGKGIEHALANINNLEKGYAQKNIRLYNPFVILVTGSIPDDNWQPAAQKLKQAVDQNQLTFLTIGIEGISKNVLEEIAQVAPPKTPPTFLKDLKFEPVFYHFAKLLKQVASRQGRERSLERLSSVVHEAESTMLQSQVPDLEEYVAQFMAEASKVNPSQQALMDIAATLIQAARSSKQGQKISNVVEHVTRTLGFS